MKSSSTLLLTLACSLVVACSDGIDPQKDDPTAEPVAADPPVSKAAPQDGRADSRVDVVRTGTDEPADDAADAKSAPKRAKSDAKRDAKSDAKADTKADAKADADADAVDPDAELTVKRLVISSGVSDREPAGAAKTFTAGAQDRIYAFVEVGNEDRAQSEVFVSFFKDGSAERGGVRLRVGPSPRWRTWSFTRLANDPGTWHAVVRNGKGQELARTSFEIVGAGATPAKSDAPDA